MKTSDCTITSFEYNDKILRGRAIKVYHKPTSETYMYYGHQPQLLKVTDDLPSYYHPTKFSIMQAKRFIGNLGSKL